MFEDVNTYVYESSKILDIGERVLTLLLNPEIVIKFEIPFERETGEILSLKGFRVRHSSVRGPSIGGLRYNKTVDENRISGLSSLMTWQAALFNLPFGGSMGGVSIEPERFTKKELKEITKKYVSILKNFIGDKNDIILPEMNTNAETMLWIVNEYAKYKGFSPGVALGKPSDFFGIGSRERAAGIGLSFILEKILEEDERALSNLSIIIHGFGNLARNVASSLKEKGAKIIGVSDEKGAVFNKNGLDIDAIISIKEEKERVQEYEDAEKLTNPDLLASECDVLILCSVESVVGEHNCRDIKANYIVEGAFGALTAQANKYLESVNKVVVPDLLSNAGALIFSYYEWIQNKQRVNIEEEEVIKNVQNTLLNVYRDLSGISVARNISLRIASYIVSVARVMRAWTLKGI